jgi:HEAT repeat protein
VLVAALALVILAAGACTGGSERSSPLAPEGSISPAATRSAAELIEVITTTEDPDELIAAATELADALDPDAIADLVALAAGNGGAEAAVEVVRDRLIVLYDEEANGDDPDRRALIVASLVAMGDETSTETLVRVLAEDPDDGVADLAAQGLRDLGSLPEVVDLLVEARSGLTAGTRATALEDLIASTGSAGVDALVGVLGEADWAADVLARIGPDAVDPLAGLIGSGNLGTDLAAIAALREIERLHPKAAGYDWAPLMADMIEKLGGPADHRASSILMAIGEPAMPQLFDLVGQTFATPTGRENDRAQSAGIILDQMGREGGAPVPFLRQKLAQRDYEFIRKHAIYFIHLGKPGSEAALITALDQTGDLIEAPVLDFLESGHPPLVEAARAWASRHGYTITGQAAGFLSWGDWGIYD